MSSIKCKKCGLVNFSTATECKRCLTPFKNKQSKSAHFQNYQMPPAPPVFDGDAAYQNSVFQPKPPCIKCGSNQNIAIRNFKKIYNSPVALLGIFLGILPYIILQLLLRTTHHLSAPFCHECWSRYKNADSYSVLIALGAFAGFILAMVAAFAAESFGVFLLGVIVTLILYAFGKSYVKKISPKFKKVNAKQVIIDAPLVGEILYTK